jgi:hypothetical protein
MALQKRHWHTSCKLLRADVAGIRMRRHVKRRGVLIQRAVANNDLKEGFP